jgi:hypothetical protein
VSVDGKLGRDKRPFAGVEAAHAVVRVTDMTPDAAARPGLERIYPWPRFWVPQDGVTDLSDGGFLRDTTDWLAGTRGPMPLAAL